LSVSRLGTVALFCLFFMLGCPVSVAPPTPPSAPRTYPDPVPNGPSPTTKADHGGACSTASDCISNICEGGCGAGQGVCQSAKRMCTMDIVPFCGCDNVTFETSSSCPGRQFIARGACKATAVGNPTGSALTDGAACFTPEDCASGICEGLGCDAKSPGVCAAKARSCTRDLRTYCGCDGVTFQGSGSCPGKRFSSRGACVASGK
jgi:hypothetical protein